MDCVSVSDSGLLDGLTSVILEVEGVPTNNVQSLNCVTVGQWVLGSLGKDLWFISHEIVNSLEYVLLATDCFV